MGEVNGLLCWKWKALKQGRTTAFQHQKICLMKMALPLLCRLREQHSDTLVKTGLSEQKAEQAALGSGKSPSLEVIKQKLQ